MGSTMRKRKADGDGGSTWHVCWTITFYLLFGVSSSKPTGAVDVHSCSQTYESIPQWPGTGAAEFFIYRIDVNCSILRTVMSPTGATTSPEYPIVALGTRLQFHEPYKVARQGAKYLATWRDSEGIPHNSSVRVHDPLTAHGLCKVEDHSCPAAKPSVTTTTLPPLNSGTPTANKPEDVSDSDGYIWGALGFACLLMLGIIIYLFARRGQPGKEQSCPATPIARSSQNGQHSFTVPSLGGPTPSTIVMQQQPSEHWSYYDGESLASRSASATSRAIGVFIREENANDSPLERCSKYCHGDCAPTDHNATAGVQPSEGQPYSGTQDDTLPAAVFNAEIEHSLPIPRTSENGALKRSVSPVLSGNGDVGVSGCSPGNTGESLSTSV